MAGKRRRRRGIYLLPNLFTTGCLLCGFYAITASMQGEFEKAVVALFFAMVMDGLDGRVARLTQTESAFGAEYDSLSDMVAFGMAPALMVYLWSLSELKNLGWFVSFFYAAATALRLARFNTQIGIQDRRYFQGLPSPASAAVVASFVWLGEEGLLPGWIGQPLIALLALSIALLMVSNFRYYSFKEIDIGRRIPFFWATLLALLAALLLTHPPSMLFLLFFGYALSGPVLTLWFLHKRRRGRRLAR